MTSCSRYPWPYPTGSTSPPPPTPKWAPPFPPQATSSQPSASPPPSKKRYSGDGGEASPASKNRKTKSPPLPREFERVIQDRDRARERSVTAPRLVIQKELFATDVATNKNRLSIPISQIRDDFLTAEERRKVAMKLIEVKMVAPSLEWEKVKFNRWDMAKDNGSKTSSMEDGIMLCGRME